MTKESDIKFGDWLKKNAQIILTTENGKLWRYKNEGYNTETIWHIYRKEQLK